MLTLTDRGHARLCNGLKRRDFLQVGTLGAAGLSLAGYTAAKAQGAVRRGHDERACIMIFNLGAPSQLDTWDIHGSKPFTSIEGMKNIVAPLYDRAYSALIEDLSVRGLLDSTLVCNLQEFGRTPRINPAGGRDHWPQCYSVYFAGGGVQGGRVVGKSDPIGSVPVERPVEPADVVATIYHSLGFNLETDLPGAAGRPFPLVDFGHREISELF